MVGELVQTKCNAAELLLDNSSLGSKIDRQQKWSAGLNGQSSAKNWSHGVVSQFCAGGRFLVRLQSNWPRNDRLDRAANHRRRISIMMLSVISVQGTYNYVVALTGHVLLFTGTRHRTHP